IAVSSPINASAARSRCVSAATRSSVTVEDAVDQPVLDGLLGREEAVALHVGAHLLGLASRVLSVDLVDAVAHVEDLARVYLDVRRLPFKARRGLMDEDARVGQR